jgi:hypothetical protein
MEGEMALVGMAFLILGVGFSMILIFALAEDEEDTK